MKKCLQCEKQFKPKRKEQVYCSKSCASVKKGQMRKGQKTGPRENWVYKKQIDSDGYVRKYGLLHPYSEGRLMIPEHVMVMELHVGRRLKPDESVHHKNRNRQDNRLENLELMKKSDHYRMHGKMQHRQRDSEGCYA